MEKRWCSACGGAFDPRPQSPRQAYCPADACQQARKRLWQRTKRRTDADYRENQGEAQATWRRSHPDYWHQYREAHPDYTASNRQQQKRRNTRRAGGDGGIAKSDASTPRFPATGIFRLTQLEPDYRGVRREWMVQLTLIAAT
ncbi:MAG TPA: hypothetical protein PLO41_00550 [Rubrivivax sp.]|nr:hypothetical protein [Rubrivivax sp.]